MKRFEKQVAIITGASAGLGFAYAKRLSNEGAKVVLIGASERGKNAEKLIRKMGGEATFIQCDVRAEESVKRAVEKTIEIYGTIHILINNAQATSGKDAMPSMVEDTSLSQMETAWRSGLLGTFFFIKECVPYMKKQGYGRICNTGSGAGIQGLPTFAAYGSQKEAIRGLTRTVAREYGRDGITCNCICPGALTEASKLWKESDPQGFEEAMSPMPIPHLGDPDEEVAPIVAFIVSREAGYLTGQTIGVDGGSTILV